MTRARSRMPAARACFTFIFGSGSTAVVAAVRECLVRSSDVRRSCACVRARLRSTTTDVDTDDDDDGDDVRRDVADERQRQPRPRHPESGAGEALDEDPHQRVDFQPVALRVLVRHRPGQALRELW